MSAEELEPQTLDELAGQEDAPKTGPTVADAPASDGPARKGGGRRRGRPPKTEEPPADPPADDDEDLEDEPLELGPVGLSAITLEQRRYSAQGAGSMVASAAARAEGIRGGKSDLVIIAVEPGLGLELLGKLKGVLEADAEPASVDA